MAYCKLALEIRGEVVIVQTFHMTLYVQVAAQISST